jgi:hypothetical protein
MLLLIEGFILSPMNNEQLRINLMVDYVDWVDRDYVDTSQSNWSGVLSNDQINSWHNTMVGYLWWKHAFY